jgi:hypothetical protein
MEAECRWLRRFGFVVSAENLWAELKDANSLPDFAGGHVVAGNDGNVATSSAV